MRDLRSPFFRATRGFRAGAVGGVLIGLVLGSAGMSLAAFGYQGWQRFTYDFKVGYVTGFLAMAGLARNLEPGGWVDTKYPDVPTAKPADWAAAIDELYKDPENQGYSMPSIMMSAARRLEEKYGKAMSPDQRTRKRMEHQLEVMRKNREAAGLETAEPKTIPVPPKVVPGLVRNRKSSVTKDAPKKPAPKWCRCDGKDPKAARAARKAAAAAKNAEQGGKDAAKSPAAVKTPPAAAKQPAEKSATEKQPAEKSPAKPVAK